jgi:methylthioribulose-1-phosphate dehydratase
MSKESLPLSGRDARPCVSTLIEYSRIYYERGWMVATAGNLSVFDREIGELWITSSGKHKGRLKEEDFICMNLDGKILRETTNKPSAEASIHQVIYRQIPSACAVLHVHTVTSCKLQFGIQKWHPATRFLLPNVEILKAFGDFREEPNFSTLLLLLIMALFVDISRDLENALRERPSDVPFFLIENHGLTVWGKSVEDANKNLEAAEFILASDGKQIKIELPDVPICRGFLFSNGV